MGKILVSGLVNMETTVPVRQFPVQYYPIDYPFFGVNTAVSGVAYNIAKALTVLGDQVTLLSLIGQDVSGEMICRQLESDGISTAHIRPDLQQTAASVVLYDPAGNRQIYCDLKDVQESRYDFPEDLCREADIVVACNTNFNRPLLHLSKSLGKTVATDVHVLSDVFDGYNREFLECADIVFLSDEVIGDDHRSFLRHLADTYPMKILVLGRGSKGAALYQRATDDIREYPAASIGNVVNTVGAGDALFSAFLHSYARGLSPEEALARAQLFAAIKIQTSGAAQGFPTRDAWNAQWSKQQKMI